MKTLLLPENIGEMRRGLRQIADSALGRNRQPVFLPDDFTGLESRMMVAVRMSRLGKDIALRFASRYYDAVGCAIVTEEAEPSRRDALSLIADNACVTGDWTEMSRIDKPDILISAAISPLREDMVLETKSARVADFRQKIDRAIAEISKGVTFKTGDLLLMETGICLRPRPDIDVEGKIEDDISLRIHFK